MCAEQAAGVGGAGRWAPFARGLALRSRRDARGYLEPFCRRPRSPRRPEVGAWGCPSARAGPQPAADVRCSWTLEVPGGGGEVFQSARQTLPGQSSLNRTFSRACAQQPAPPGPRRSVSLGHRPASSCGLVLVPA